MFTHLKLSNFAAFAQLDWPHHAAMNLIIGENDTGKSHLLKMLYTFARSVNDWQKSQGGLLPITWDDSFIRKLVWTFQTRNDDMDNLIRHGTQSCQMEAWLGGADLVCGLEYDVKNKKIRSGFSKNVDSPVDTLAHIGHTLFLPPKEIMTAMDAMEATRQRIEILGFDDTYLDLIQDFRAAPTYGDIEAGFNTIPATIKQFLDGGEIIKKGFTFVFKRGEVEYSMAQTAEGIKKIAILSRLILNRSITKGSIVLVDEPEANLHPKAVIAMADILFDLSQAGAQLYVATHSFYFLSRIEQRVRKSKSQPVSLLDLRRSETGVIAHLHDLRDGIPDNPIDDQSAFLMNESIRLDWE